MSLPRPVFPGRFYLVTRRIIDRQYFLRPDDETNNNYLYCLAEAAERNAIEVLLSSMLSNHHHTVVYDRNGTINEFSERFHGLLARSQNALRGRWDYFWDNRGPSIVELLTLEAVMAELAYTAVNPVKHDLVERTHHWPGLNALAALRTGRTLRATRPKHFFRADGPMPESVEIMFRIPPELGDHSRIVSELCDLVEAEEKRFAEMRLRENRRVFGRARILRQSWSDSPKTVAPRRETKPRFAAKDEGVRLRAVMKYRLFVKAHARSRADWLAGIPTVFPAGTYWLRRFMKVPTEPIA